MRPLRVLMIVGDYPPMISGVGDYTALLSKALVKRGIDVSVVTTILPETPRSDSVEGVRIYRRVHKWSFSSLRELLRFAGDYRPDIIHIQYHCPQTYRRHLLINFLPGIFRIAERRSRIVVTHHGFHEVSKLWKLRILPMLVLPHGVILVTRRDLALLDALLKAIGVRSRFIQIGSNIPCVESSSATGALSRSALGFKENEFVVAFFGGIRPDKGLENLINAIRGFVSEGLAIRLLVIGGFEYQWEAVSAYSQHIRAELSIAQSEGWAVLTRAPEPERVSSLFGLADLAVFPFREGAGENSGSLLAALSNGVPIITTQGSSTPTGFAETYGVTLVQASDSVALTNAIREVAESPELCKKLREFATIAGNRISWDAIAKDTLAFYESCLGHS